MTERRNGYTTAGKQSITLADLEASRAPLSAETCARLQELEFTIIRLGDRLAAVTGAAREVVAVEREICRHQGYSVELDFRYQKAMAALAVVLRAGE